MSGRIRWSGVVIILVGLAWIISTFMFFDGDPSAIVFEVTEGICIIKVLEWNFDRMHKS